MKEFPENFLFGSSTSSFQQTTDYEGISDLGRYIKLNPHRINFHRKGELGPNWYENKNILNDLELLGGELKLNTQRFSIDWARMQPRKGIVSKKMISFYDEVLKKLADLKMSPLVTINHFTLPTWVADQGGWENPQTIIDFKEYTKILVDNFGDVKNWVTINEPILAVGHRYLSGMWPPHKKDPVKTWMASKMIIEAHDQSYQVLKEFDEKNQVGMANAMLWFKPYKTPEDVLVTRVSNEIYNWGYLQLTNNYDFIGINYYKGLYAKTNPLSLKLKLFPESEAISLVKKMVFAETIRPNVKKSDMGWPIVPDFFKECLKETYARFRKPIVVTENGIADKKDLLRTNYLVSHLAVLSDAIKEGVDVRGYYHWSSTSNRELLLENGFDYDFGLIKIDHLTGKREIRESAKIYSQIVSSGKIDNDLFRDLGTETII